MRTQRPRPANGRRLAPGFVALAAAVAVAGCTAAGPDSADPGPPRLAPNPQPDIAAAMVEGRPAPQERLNACELLALTTEEIIDLTGADMPVVDPTGSGDLGLLCTYGGPGSPERYEAGLAGADAEAGAGGDAGGAAEAGAEAEVLGPEAADPGMAGPEAPEAPEGGPLDIVPGIGSDTATADAESTDAGDTDAEPTEAEATDAEATATDAPPAFDPEIIPDTFAAGVVTPPGGAEAALVGQAALLGVRYACSEIRGTVTAEMGAPAPGAPEAPAIVEPQPDTSYVDCVAAPAGGGVEVHTILVAGDELWHITLLKPETPRSPQAEASALVGLHRVAQEIVAT